MPWLWDGLASPHDVRRRFHGPDTRGDVMRARVGFPSQPLLRSPLLCLSKLSHRLSFLA